MNNFLKKLFPKKYPTGAFQDVPDTRQVVLSSVQAPVLRPKKSITDLSVIPVLMQGRLGTCVAHVIAEYKMWLDYKETGAVTTYSRRWFYAFVRFFAKMFEMGQGLYPRDGMKVLVNVGITKDKGLDDNTLSHDKYVDVKFTAEDRAEANTLRAKSFAAVIADKEAVAQALYQNGLMTVSLPYSPSGWLSGLLTRIFSWVSRHYVLVYGYEELTNGDLKLFFRNSWDIFWGFKGNGEFLWSEYGDKAEDMYVILDLPNNILQRAKDSRFIFLRDLSIGSRGEDVLRLQQALITRGIFIDDPTSYFGLVTKDCVTEYQRLMGLPQTGYFGPMTREAINADNKANPKPKSKLDLWCEAIKDMEGAQPEINNPGNIKYFPGLITSKKATGKKLIGKNVFCVYPDYATGYMVLRDLLLRAATGLSTSYRPDMTLQQFYHVYAPSSDLNNPDHYANFVAGRIGVPVTTKISELI